MYRALPKLEKLGLIERTLEKPMRARATPMEKAFSVLVKKYQEQATQRVSTLTDELNALAKEIKTHESKNKPHQEEQMITLVLGKEALLNKYSTLIEETERQLDIIAPANALYEYSAELSGMLKRALKRDVTIRVITEKTKKVDLILIDSRNKRLASERGLDVKYIESLPGNYAISDSNQALISTTVDVGRAERAALWTNNKEMIELLSKNYGNLWFFASLNPSVIEFKSFIKK